MNKKAKSHFVFDFDDTLADSYSFNQQMFVETFDPYLELSHERAQAYLRGLHFKNRGAAMIKIFEKAQKKFSLKVSPEILVRKNDQLHQKNFGQIKLFPAVVKFVRLLKKQQKELFICTNRDVHSAELILKKYHLKKLFSEVVSCKDAGREKPDPFCLLKLVKKTGQSKENFIYFGDSNVDFQFADNAGVDAIIIDHYLNQKSFYEIIIQTFLD
ncbi:MAG: HAD-IA family hydrolase [Candidatus Pacebacteria bacterium]|nr:HAD-IA family hydrolase [Candidatus Paceibacterota bacterium]